MIRAPDADVDGQWTVHMDVDPGGNTLSVPEWAEATDTIYDGGTATVVLHNGTATEVKDENEHDCDSDDEPEPSALNKAVGEILTDIVLQLRDDGTLAKLPLPEDAYKVIEEFNGGDSWPEFDSRKKEGRIQQ